MELNCCLAFMYYVGFLKSHSSVPYRWHANVQYQQDHQKYERNNKAQYFSEISSESLDYNEKKGNFSLSLCIWSFKN